MTRELDDDKSKRPQDELVGEDSPAEDVASGKANRDEPAADALPDASGDVAHDTPNDAAPQADALSAEIRELIEQLSPKGRRTFVIDSHELESPEDANLTLEECANWFASKAERKKQELIATGKMADPRSLAAPERSSPSRIEHAIIRPGDERGSSEHAIVRPGDAPGSIVQLGEPRENRSPSGFEEFSGEPPWQLPLSTTAAGGASGPAIPQLQIFVQLTDTRTHYEGAIETALDKKAPQYHEIAQGEVERGFWWYECQRRAADHRLRGPG